MSTRQIPRLYQWRHASSPGQMFPGKLTGKRMAAFPIGYLTRRLSAACRLIDATTIRRHWLPVLSVALFLACLFFQTFYYAAFPTDKSYGNGWSALAAGWLGLLEGIPAWLANPLLIAAWVAYFRRKYQQSFLLSVAAIGLMLSFILETQVVRGASGLYSAITSYGLGYYLWLSSAVAQMFASSG